MVHLHITNMKQYIIYAWDDTDPEAISRRMNKRPAHFENASVLKAKGNFITGGALLDDTEKMIGSCMIMQFENEAGLKEWLNTEPYITGGVWKKFEVHPFKLATVI